MNKVETQNELVRKENFLRSQTSGHSLEPDLIDIKRLAFVTSMSRSTIFRLIKDPEFPRLKIGGILLFDKREVLDYLKHKFGNLDL